MNDWEKTLARFRALGGVIDNIELREGVYGRGLFPVDNKRPVKLIVPNHLLLPVDWLELDEQGSFKLNVACDWAEEVKEFYLDYLKDYGFSNSLMKQLNTMQSELYDLPQSVKNMVAEFGMVLAEEDYFQMPTLKRCLENYKISRRISLDGKRVLMPFAELVNHDGNSKVEFQRPPALGFSGDFNDEILVNYGIEGDAVMMFRTYGFSEVRPYVYSGAFTVNLGPVALNVARFLNVSETIGNVIVPEMRIKGSDLSLSHLKLIDLKDKLSPKRTFVELMKKISMPEAFASQVFDGAIEQNIRLLTELLEQLKPLKGTVVDSLRTMVKNQLFSLGVDIESIP